MLVFNILSCLLGGLGAVLCRVRDQTDYAALAHARN
jgi:hypothetical protein